MSDISLAEMLQVGRKPRKSIQLSLLRLAAAQLDQAHQTRLVHGNLTPQSIIISQGANEEPVAVTISDFGTSFNFDPGAKTGRIPDEAFYLSPEQILGIDVTPASDEFSFGVIAYEMVSGRRPFDSASVSGLIFAVCTDEPIPVHDIDNSLTPGVSAVFSRALAKDRERRYLSCGQFVAALEAELMRSDGWAETGAAAYSERSVRFGEQAHAFRSSAEQGPPIGSTASAVFTDPSATQLFATPPSVTGVPPRASGVSEPPPVSPPPPRPAAPFPAPYVTSPFSAPPLNNPRQDVPFDSTVREPEYPPARRRQRYEDEETVRSRESPLARFAVIAAVLILLGSAAFYFLNRPAKPDLPTQVLDTKNAPVTPPPANNSESPSTTSSAPAPVPTQPSPQAQAEPAPESAAPVPQAEENQSQARNNAAASVPAPPPQDTVGTKTNQPRRSERAQTSSAQVAPEERGGSAAVAIELLSEPPGATITVDNNPRLACRAPCTLSVGDGRHTLAAQLGGYTVAQRIFNVPETSSVFIAMPKLTGALVVTSNPAAATILVDGKDYGMTPATLHLSPGQHRITLMNGSQRHDETVDVVADGIQATGYTFPR